MERLNYHHLLYFWMVAREGTVARAAAQLRLAQPTLSGQIRFVVASGVRGIVTTVNCCRPKRIPIAVRGKAAQSPYGMANDAVVIDLMRMTAVRVDPEKKLAFIQAGADGGDVWRLRG